MRRISYALVVLLLVGLAQAQQSVAPTPHSTKLETHLLPQPHTSVSITAVNIGERLDGPHWWNDHATYHSIYSHGEVPNVAMTNRDGTVAFTTTLTAPNLDRIRVTDAAATKDGGAVATATVVDKAGTPSSFVAQLDNSGRVIRQITTFPFMAEMTCPAEDGTVWVFGWDFSENHGPHIPYSILRHYSFTQGLLKVAPDWTAIGNRVLFGYHVAGGTAVACTDHKSWVYYGERRQFVAYDEESNSFRTYRVQLPDGSPSDLEASGFARTTSGDFYGSLNDGSEVWLGLYWLNVHDGVAEWVAVDTPGNFENGVRISAQAAMTSCTRGWRGSGQSNLSSRPRRQICSQNCLQEVQAVLRRGDGELNPGSPMPYGDEALNRRESSLPHERGERPLSTGSAVIQCLQPRTLSEHVNAETGALHRACVKLCVKKS